MSTSYAYKVDGASKSNDGVCDVNDMLQNLNTADNDINISVCANCGKEGANNSCNKCKMVKYCNAACKKKHRTKHKKQCERRVAELRDEQLFKDHPTPKECPICLLPMLDADLSIFKSCCGKVICGGCLGAMIDSDLQQFGEEKVMNKRQPCPYCRMPLPVDNDEEGRRTLKLDESGNAYALVVLGECYSDGRWGMPQDRTKAIELFRKAIELGCDGGFYSLGRSYALGYGVDEDMKKGVHYLEQAAMNGHIEARHMLGIIEETVGNDNRASLHFIIAARAGYKDSLDQVKTRYIEGLVTKDEYANTLRMYQKRQDEMKSDARDKYAAVKWIFS